MTGFTEDLFVSFVMWAEKVLLREPDQEAFVRRALTGTMLTSAEVESCMNAGLMQIPESVAPILKDYVKGGAK